MLTSTAKGLFYRSIFHYTSEAQRNRVISWLANLPAKTYAHPNREVEDTLVIDFEDPKDRNKFDEIRGSF